MRFAPTGRPRLCPRVIARLLSMLMRSPASQPARRARASPGFGAPASTTRRSCARPRSSATSTSSTDSLTASAWSSSRAPDVVACVHDGTRGPRPGSSTPHSRRTGGNRRVDGRWPGACCGASYASWSGTRLRFRRCVRRRRNRSLLFENWRLVTYELATAGEATSWKAFQGEIRALQIGTSSRSTGWPVRRPIRESFQSFRRVM